MKTADNDFATFVQTNWSLVEPSKLIWSPHMQIICDAFQDVVEGRNNRLIVNVPHGMSKSLLSAVFLPAWIRKAGGGRVAVVSNDIELAQRDRRRSRLGTPDDRLNQQKFTSIEWFSVAASVCARQFDVLILDVSNDMRRGTHMLDAVETVWMPRLYHSRKSKVILIETRSEYGDVTGRLLGNGEWRHICLPMVYDSTVAKEDFRTEGGQLLCPERWTQEPLNGYRLMLGEVGFNAQYQQNPPTRAGEALHAAPKPVAVSVHASTPEVTPEASTGAASAARQAGFPGVVVLPYGTMPDPVPQPWASGNRPEWAASKSVPVSAGKIRWWPCAGCGVLCRESSNGHECMAPIPVDAPVLAPKHRPSPQTGTEADLLVDLSLIQMMLDHGKVPSVNSYGRIPLLDRIQMAILGYMKGVEVPAVPVGVCSNKNCYVHDGESCAKGGDSASCLDRVS